MLPIIVESMTVLQEKNRWGSEKGENVSCPKRTGWPRSSTTGEAGERELARELIGAEQEEAGLVSTGVQEKGVVDAIKDKLPGR